MNRNVKVAVRHRRWGNCMPMPRVGPHKSNHPNQVQQPSYCPDGTVPNVCPDKATMVKSVSYKVAVHPVLVHRRRLLPLRAIAKCQVRPVITVVWNLRSMTYKLSMTISFVTLLVRTVIRLFLLFLGIAVV